MSGTSSHSLSESLLADFLNLLDPRHCAVCSAKLTPCEQLLCSHCLVSLPYLGIHDFNDNEVARLLQGYISVEKAYAHIRYRQGTQSQTLLWKLKYRQRPDIGLKMGLFIGQELSERGFFDDIEAIVPVPLHWRRWLSRGYNQSVQLAKGLAKATRLPVLQHLVRRTQNNQSQTGMSPAERRDNVEGIFRARSTHYRHLLLVDDVLTTGATVASCAQAILQHNPDIRFSVLSLAKA